VLYLDLDVKDKSLYYSKYNNTYVDNSNKIINNKLIITIKFVSKEKVLEKFDSPYIIIINCFSIIPFLTNFKGSY
jgi:hypothetical protein